ncbi:cytochrome-c peroxidase [Fibrella aquatilis]|uniref:C-type cytochrome n=1 Tax=Fibrella aquatilis TaxID=2817059 RepID=A0A939JZZ7_9BACT|nr:cytochrome c peroxidase [Fibrella aquatilis]MBO0931466.1 c-type cytochrome [Fibrella aquatilis]
MPSSSLTCVGVAALVLVLTAARTSLPVPTSEPLPTTAVALGKLLFFDPILSGNQQVSCASCHKPEFAFADNMPLSVGINGNFTSRNTPSVMYTGKQLHFFWDGRVGSLEEQAINPITNSREMNLPLDKIVGRLKKNPFYLKAFDAVFQADPDINNLSTALADFQRSLSTYDSAYDRFTRGDIDAMSEAAVRGLNAYLTSNCKECHGIEGDFAMDKFANIGLYKRMGKDDVGRFAISRDSADLGKFKVPNLRNIALTAPYMHDGSVSSLREVIEFYNDSVHFSKSINVDEAMYKQERPMTKEEIDDLLVFLQALTDKRFLN